MCRSAGQSHPPAPRCTLLCRRHRADARAWLLGLCLCSGEGQLPECREPADGSPRAHRPCNAVSSYCVHHPPCRHRCTHTYGYGTARLKLSTDRPQMCVGWLQLKISSNKGRRLPSREYTRCFLLLWCTGQGRTIAATYSIREGHLLATKGPQLRLSASLDHLQTRTSLARLKRRHNGGAGVALRWTVVGQRYGLHSSAHDGDAMRLRTAC